MTTKPQLLRTVRDAAQDHLSENPVPTWELLEVHDAITASLYPPPPTGLRLRPGRRRLTLVREWCP